MDLTVWFGKDNLVPKWFQSLCLGSITSLILSFSELAIFYTTINFVYTFIRLILSLWSVELTVYCCYLIWYNRDPHCSVSRIRITIRIIPNVTRVFLVPAAVVSIQKISSNTTLKIILFTQADRHTDAQTVSIA